MIKTDPAKTKERKAKRKANRKFIEKMPAGFHFSYKSKRGEVTRLKEKIEHDQNAFVLLSSDGKCFYWPECGCHGKAECCDHVIPKSRGLWAKFSMDNRVPASIQCNGQKGSMANNGEKFAAIYIKKNGLDKWLWLEEQSRTQVVDSSTANLRMLAQEWDEKLKALKESLDTFPK